MKFIYTVICLLACYTATQAQECAVILLGEISDFHDNTPLEGATVYITGKSASTTSNKEGKFTFTSLCNGVIELEISHPDCKSQFVTVTLNGNTFKKINLEHHVEALEEVSVVGSNGQKKTNSNQEVRLDVKELDKYGANSLGDALEKIIGITTLNTGGNIVKPVIQGLNGSRVIILNNNVRMQDMEWGAEHAPNIDVNANQKISVIKGAGALQYGGDAIGGVIVIEPQIIIKKDTLFGKTKLDAVSNGRGGNLSSTLVKSYNSGFYIKGQASFKMLGDLEAPNYILSNTGIKQKGVTFQVGKRGFKQGWEGYFSYFDSDIGILRAAHIGNIDDLIASVNSEQPNIIDPFTYNIIAPKQEVSHYIGKVKYYKRFKALGKLSLQYDYQNNHRLEYDVRVGNDKHKASLDLELSTHTFTSNLKVDAFERTMLNVGILGRYQNNFANPDTGVKRLIPDYNKSDFGIFAISEHHINDYWLVDIGLRYDFSRIDAKKYYKVSRWNERNYDTDYADIIISEQNSQYLVNPIFNYHNLSFTTGIKHEFSEHSLFRVNYSLSNRAPNPSELFSDGLHHSAAQIELGDLRIKSESANKLSGSIERVSNTWGYNVAPYINFINDFILLEPTGVEYTLRGAFPVWSYRQTNALFYGVDVSIYKKWTSNFTSNHNFSWLQGEDRTNKNAPLINIPPTTFKNEIVYSYKNWKNLIISAESSYVFKQKNHPDNLEVYSPNQQEEVTLAINTTPKAYHLLNLDAESTFNIKKSKLSVGCKVSNVLNTTYRNYLNRLRYYADETGRSVNIRFIYTY